MNQATVEHRHVRTGDVRLHVALAGPRDGTPVFLLHGFPDAWFGWRRQISALAAAGFRVVAPDQRGYGGSDKPRGIRAYALARLTGDILALAGTLDMQRFQLVGHDWGGIVAWGLAAKAAERVDRLVILNAPHPDVLYPYALRSPTQFLRSSYAAFFQFPLLPELLLGARDGEMLARALRATARPGAFSDADLAAYRRAWAEPGTLTAMLNWYRALRFRAPLPAPIDCPTLILWGMKDTALEAGLAAASAEKCRDAEIRKFHDATHWLQREEPAAVNAALLDFLQRHDQE